jgi:SMI1-KNR4 cell-wall
MNNARWCEGMPDDIAGKVEPIDGNFEPCDEADIIEVEKVIGFGLPASYAIFLGRFGRCGFSGEATIESSANVPPQGIFTIFGCKGSAGNMLQDRAIHPEYISMRLLPIADDNFNNRYVLDGNTGEIYFIDYSHRSGAMDKVADSFDQFLGRLKVVPWS